MDTEVASDEDEAVALAAKFGYPARLGFRVRAAEDMTSVRAYMDL